MKIHATPSNLTLKLAAIYNLVWGALVILFPKTGFELLGLESPNYPQIWQCLGMVIGVYGIGYGIAARDPVRHWPIVFVGLLGKILGPIGFIYFAVRGEFPWIFGLTIIPNDLIWWPGFARVLYKAYGAHGLRV